MVLESFSVSLGKASAYFPVIDLLYNYFKILGEDDQRARRAKVTGNVLTLDRALEDTLPYVLALLGIADEDDPLARTSEHDDNETTRAIAGNPAARPARVRSAPKRRRPVRCESVRWLRQ